MTDNYDRWGDLVAKNFDCGMSTKKKGLHMTQWWLTKDLLQCTCGLWFIPLIVISWSLQLSTARLLGNCGQKLFMIYINEVMVKAMYSSETGMKFWTDATNKSHGCRVCEVLNSSSILIISRISTITIGYNTSEVLICNSCSWNW